MSTESKHTPGPWIYGTHQDSAMVQTAEPCKTVATVYGPKPSEREANARLIAAAPDLLTQLKEALAWAEKARIMAPAAYWTGDARAAIAKATN